MSDGFGQVLSIMSFWGRLGEKYEVQTGAFGKTLKDLQSFYNLGNNRGRL